MVEETRGRFLRSIQQILELFVFGGFQVFSNLELTYN